ncbi:hypothetical protein PINS_up020260 [Pythium insidiosum]|nr:hypothetical protein PINS_up003202 [Pythium insidiosum]GLE08836.1 hypothetical protein PINS_up020260 [Pythium insidiosum]
MSSITLSVDAASMSQAEDTIWVAEVAQQALLSPSDNVPRPFACTEPGCNQRFKRKFTLKEHIKTHTGEKPFVCPVVACGKTFTTSGNLARHKRLHPWLKPLICHVDGCGRSFSTEAKLERHIKSHFDGTRSHRCPYVGCGKDFSTAGNLTRHVKQQHHDDEEVVMLDGSSDEDGSCEAEDCKTPVAGSPASVDESVFQPLSWPQSPSGFYSSERSPMLLAKDPEIMEALSILLD